MATIIALPSTTSFKKNGVPVCGVDTISFGFGEVEDVDVSSFCQESDYREYAAGMKDAGELTASGKFDPEDAGFLAVLADSATGAKDTYTIEFEGGYVYTVTAYPKPSNMTANIGEAVTVDLMFKISGKPSFMKDTDELY